MKTGKSLTELAQELTRQNESKIDFKVSPKAIEIQLNQDEKPILSLDKRVFGMTDNFHNQIGTELEIPRKYYDKMLSNSPELLTQNVNHWLAKQSNARLVRTLDGNARAYLSDKFRPLDNYDLAQVALPELLKSGCRVESCEVTEKKFYLKAVTERITFEVKKGEIVQAGICMTNSEVGNGTLGIAPLLYMCVCTNGMVINDLAYKKYHVGRGSRFDFEGAVEFYKDETRLADDRALWLKVRDTIAHAFSQIDFAKIAARLTSATQDPIEAEPIAVVELTKKRFSLSDSEGDSILQNLLRDGDMTRYGLANAVTRAAQDIESYDRATEFERLGGEIIELPRNQWPSLSATMQ